MMQDDPMMESIAGRIGKTANVICWFLDKNRSDVVNVEVVVVDVVDVVVDIISPPSPWYVVVVALL